MTTYSPRLSAYCTTKGEFRALLSRAMYKCRPGLEESALFALEESFLRHGLNTQMTKSRWAWLQSIANRA